MNESEDEEPGQSADKGLTEIYKKFNETYELFIETTKDLISRDYFFEAIKEFVTKSDVADTTKNFVTQQHVEDKYETKAHVVEQLSLIEKQNDTATKGFVTKVNLDS